MNHLTKTILQKQRISSKISSITIIVAFKKTEAYTSTLPIAEYETFHKCKICNHFFLTARALSTHDLITHSKINSFEWDICKKKFTTHFHIELHIVADMKLKFFFDKSILKLHNLKYHTRIHLRPNKPLFKCEICKKEFSRKENFTSHNLRHHNVISFVYDICFKDFPQKCILTSHRKIHFNENVYKWEKPFVCFKVFTKPSNLTINKRIYTGENPYSCDTCRKALLLKASLTSKDS